MIRVVVARTFVSRLIGLLAHSELADDEGLLLVAGGSIHTLGMRFAIDVVFLNQHLEVLKVVTQIGAGRIVIAPRRTRCVLEMKADAAGAAGVAVGTALTPARLTACARPTLPCANRA
jgi:uncharacterized membrane protein (UPF0127 family)